MYLLLHELPFVERYKSASIGYRLLICLKTPECMFPWQHGHSSKLLTALLSMIPLMFVLFFSLSPATITLCDRFSASRSWIFSSSCYTCIAWALLTVSHLSTRLTAAVSSSLMSASSFFVLCGWTHKIPLLLHIVFFTEATDFVSLAKALAMSDTIGSASLSMTPSIFFCFRQVFV